VLKTTNTAEAKAVEARTLQRLIFPPLSPAVKAAVEIDVKRILPSPLFRATPKAIKSVTNENDNFMLRRFKFEVQQCSIDDMAE
jgi:hypothetical protein